jgi:hypothetical protein
MARAHSKPRKRSVGQISEIVQDLPGGYRLPDPLHTSQARIRRFARPNNPYTFLRIVCLMSYSRLPVFWPTLVEVRMAYWTLLCPRCKTDFKHSEVKTISPRKDPFAWLELKPKFPEVGLLIECPNCRESSVFQQYELRYESSRFKMQE